MANEPENLVLELLREMRGDIVVLGNGLKNIRSNRDWIVSSGVSISSNCHIEVMT
jgi:hypothetical protein